MTKTLQLLCNLFKMPGVKHKVEDSDITTTDWESAEKVLKALANCLTVTRLGLTNIGIRVMCLLKLN
jgi:hypothetical protein